MDWQLAAVGVLVALSAAYLARRAWRTWAGRGAGCGGGCGCAAGPKADERPALIRPEELTLRRRG
jgi:hypothetical protein